MNIRSDGHGQNVGDAVFAHGLYTYSLWPELLLLPFDFLKVRIHHVVISRF
jgi:hypothetical protein